MRLSVIIPALNEEKSIAATLESVMAVEPHEIIVVDGGSTDRTCAICRDFGEALRRTFGLLPYDPVPGTTPLGPDPRTVNPPTDAEEPDPVTNTLPAGQAGHAQDKGRPTLPPACARTQ